ncbi:hypothetical protein MKW94_009612 [Papaver nudicaule]|uniref:Protein FRA10AC1 n=2 Tax=Magnoliopsida TaxID=3398 RepID=A0AA41VTP2_PAPNU|nr:hypothetical protein [Papaver nudicaule]
MASLNSLKSAVFEKEERKQQYQSHIRGLNAFDRHKKFLKDYVDFYGTGRKADIVLPTKTDQDTLREGYRFIRSEEDDMDRSWEQRLVKRYYDKLFKEYPLQFMSIQNGSIIVLDFGIGLEVSIFGFFLSLQKINLIILRSTCTNHIAPLPVGLRWRTEKEVLSGKGQFICGNKHCDEKDNLASYEVNFSYVEAGENKQALVKLVACERCAEKLVYRKRKEKELLEKSKSHKKNRRQSESGSDNEGEHKNRKHHKEKGQLEMGEESHRKKRGRSESDIETDDEYGESHRKSSKGKKSSTSTDEEKVDDQENFNEYLEGMFP